MPTPQSWSLDWFYFGDLLTLTTDPPCSSSAAGTAGGRTALLSTLVQAGNVNDLEQQATGGLDGDPLLIRLARTFANADRKHEAYAWRKAWPLALGYYDADGSDPSPPHEFYVTEGACLLPWPFPVQSSDETLRHGFEAKQGDIKGFLSIEPEAGRPDPTQSVAVNSLFLYYDEVVKKDEGGRRAEFYAADEDARRRILIEHARSKDDDGFDLPKQLRMLLYENAFTDQSRLRYHPDEGVVFEMGWQIRRETQAGEVAKDGTEGEDEANEASRSRTIMLEPYPCGAFG